MADSVFALLYSSWHVGAIAMGVHRPRTRWTGFGTVTFLSSFSLMSSTAWPPPKGSHSRVENGRWNSSSTGRSVSEKSGSWVREVLSEVKAAKSMDKLSMFRFSLILALMSSNLWAPRGCNSQLDLAAAIMTLKHDPVTEMKGQRS